MSDASSTSLRQAARRGIRWTSAAAVAGGLLQLLQTLLLVRILEPEEFGLMAAAMVIVGFAEGLSDLGIGSAVIVREIPETALSSLFWGGLSAGAVMGGVVAATGPLVADFFGEPRIADLLLLAALLFVINPLGNIHQGLRERALDFDYVAKTETAGGVIALMATVGSALLGAGAMSFVIGLVVAAATRVSIFVATGWKRWRPAWRLRSAEIRTHLAFGGWQMGERSINHLFANIDYVLVGRFLGAEALGFYSIAYQFVVRPLAQLNPVLTRVALPVFAKRQQDLEALRRGWLELSHLIALLVLPALSVLAVVAPVLVPVAFGAEWEPSIVLIQVLAGVGILQTLFNPLGALLLARDRPDLGFKLNVVMLPLLGIALYLVVEEGAEAVAWTYLAVTAAGFAIAMPWMLSMTIGMRARDYGRALAGPAGMTAVAVALSLATYAVVDPVASDPVTLAATALAAALAYVPLVFRFERAYVSELGAVVRARGA